MGAISMDDDAIKLVPPLKAAGATHHQEISVALFPRSLRRYLIRSGRDDRASQGAFRRLLQGASVVGVLTHVAFLFLFYRSQVMGLVWVNMLSMLAYLCCWFMFRAGWAVVPMALMGLELMIHAVLATRWIGWDSGFHYYLMLVVPVALVSSVTYWWQKLPVFLGASGLYLWMDYALRTAPPQQVLAPDVLAGLHHFNLAATLCVLAFLSSVYFILIERSEKRLSELATTDPLTGLKNRRSLYQAALIEVSRHQRAAQPLAFVLADIDHFKSINDTYGHEFGDHVLKSVSVALTASLRDIDHLARWGGEEFLAILPNSNADEAMLVAQRLRETIRAMELYCEGHRVHPSITIGVSVLMDGEAVSQAISRADRALYQGKNHGRNQVRMAVA